MSDPQILAHSVSQALQTRYIALIAALGYESRCTSVATLLAPQSELKLAIGFDHNQVLSYQRNFEWFTSSNFEVIPDVTAAEFSPVIAGCLESAVSQGGGTPGSISHIAVDVSAFDRQRIAMIVDAVRRIEGRPLIVDFFYSVASFVPPNLTIGRNEVAGPVHRSFSGRFLDPGRPLALVAGLGYEIGKVVGVSEYVQASRVIALIPQSPVAEYEPEVERANSLLLNELQQKDVFRYQVDDPRRTVAILDSIARGLRPTHNIVFLPGGPKIFVLCALLAQCLDRSVSVWRVSSGSTIVARDIPASDNVVATRVVFNSELANSTYEQEPPIAEPIY